MKDREKFIEQTRKEAVRFVLSTPQGRRFVADLIYDRCRWGGAYPGNDSGLYRHEGRRAVAVELIAEFETLFHDEYVLMVTERMQDRHDDKAARDAAQDIGEEDDDAS